MKRRGFFGTVLTGITAILLPHQKTYAERGAQTVEHLEPKPLSERMNEFLLIPFEDGWSLWFPASSFEVCDRVVSAYGMVMYTVRLTLGEFKFNFSTTYHPCEAYIVEGDCPKKLLELTKDPPICCGTAFLELTPEETLNVLGAPYTNPGRGKIA